MENLSFQVYGGILGIRQQAWHLGKNAQVCQISSDQNPRCLGDIGGYTTQLNRDCNKPW